MQAAWTLAFVCGAAENSAAKKPASKQVRSSLSMTCPELVSKLSISVQKV